MSGWGCAHDDHGTCTRVAGRACDPGMKGCILAGRFRFSNPAKNRPVKSMDEPATDGTSDNGNDQPART
jgi:hypothetical protein